MQVFFKIFIVSLIFFVVNAFQLNLLKHQKQQIILNSQYSSLQLHSTTILSKLNSTPFNHEIDNMKNKAHNDLSTLKMNTLLSAAAVFAVTFLLRSQPAMASSIVPDVTDSSGFVQSFLLIFVSEIGDKTFFIAGLLAAKYGRLISFGGSIAALAVMTIISTVLGQIFHQIPASLTQGVPFDDVVAVAAFAYFGIKTLYEASKLEPGDSSGIDEEKAEAEEAVSELTASQKMSSTVALFLQTFSLVFAAEIGDRSFLSTIALSAALNPFAVASGAVLAHASATGMFV